MTRLRHPFGLVQRLGFGVWGLGFRVYGCGCRGLKGAKSHSSVVLKTQGLRV